MNHLKSRSALKIIMTCFLFFYPLYVGAAAADSSQKALFSPDFRFADGVFFSFEQVKLNEPVAKSRILTNTSFNDRDFFTDVTNQQSISFYDNAGAARKISVDKVWGYADNGRLYIQLHGVFSRITVVGAGCHFVALHTSYSSNYDPYMYGTYGYGYQPQVINKNTELRQYLLDFSTGKIYDYNYNSLEVLLMNDPELHDEFVKLRKRKKKQLKFYYLRKYNERNPVYIPTNKK
ncbi:MAG: hypothetical protein HC896_08735 [Bacteroidales bacterium]|nr:hypothetical protein [Bacteroidales bacterium]